MGRGARPALCPDPRQAGRGLPTSTQEPVHLPSLTRPPLQPDATTSCTAPEPVLAPWMPTSHLGFSLSPWHTHPGGPSTWAKSRLSPDSPEP